jgi:hypothetical protein
LSNLKPIFKTPKNKHYFFGYYDKSPLSLDGTKHLALEIDFLDHLPNKADIAKIGYFDLKKNDGVFNYLVETKIFNWQQGCMLQWFGDKNGQIIYNDLLDHKFVSIIFDLNTSKKTVLPMAIYQLSPDSKFALCIDNERHHFVRRGYSYDGISNKEKNKDIVDGDGIFLMDVENKSTKLIVDIKKIIKNKKLSSMFDGANYLEHMMFSPDGNRFAFFHRWKMNGGIYDRLYTADLDGANLFLLNDSGKMSHFCWMNSESIFGWGGVNTPANTLRKYKTVVKYFIKPLLPIYKKLVSGTSDAGVTKLSSFVTGESYIVFKDKTSKRTKISSTILNRNGHPSFSPYFKDWCITDTYPDKNAIAQLILFNIKTNQVIYLAELSSIQKYDNSANRCDLHPKWSYNGRYVSIDTMNEGVRSIYLYDLLEYING